MELGRQTHGILSASRHSTLDGIGCEDSQMEMGEEQCGAVIILPDNGRDKVNRHCEPIRGSPEAFLLRLLNKAEANGGNISLSVDDLLELKGRP